MGLRTLEKIENVIDEEMKAIGKHPRFNMCVLLHNHSLPSFVGGQRLALPLVLSSELWKKTGRWDKMGGEVGIIFFLHTYNSWLTALLNVVLSQLVV